MDTLVRSLVWISILTPIAVHAQSSWTIDSLAQAVQPMRNPIGTRLPLVVWNLPQIAYKDQAAADAASGVLAQRIATLWARGIVPAITLDESPWATANGIVAVAQALQNQGAPVHVVAMLPGGAQKFWAGPSWFTMNGVSWPVYPQADAQPAYEHVYGKLSMLQNAGVNVDALWQDYEEVPHPWNGAYTAQNWYVQNVNTTAYSSYSLDPTLPADSAKFQRYSYDLRFALLAQSAQTAFIQLYGFDKPYGNYAEQRSTSSKPAIDLNSVTHPASQLPTGMVAMPSLYANNRRLPWYIDPAETVTQAKVDDIHWFLMMRAFSSSARNDVAGELTVPFVSPAVFDLNDPRFNGWRMSSPVYRELLKHVWLRGADGMIAFTVDPGLYPQYTAEVGLASIEDARAVLDEMLDHREFLEQGTPMTFAFEASPNYGPRTVWSGLTRADDALVHVTSLDGSTQPAIVNAFGTSFSLPVEPSAGATYYLHRGAEPHRVDPCPPPVDPTGAATR